MHLQARLQQQLSKSRPIAPPPTFSAPATGSRVPTEPAASTRVTAVTSAAPPPSTAAAVRVTSAASSCIDSGDHGRLSKPVAPDTAPPVSENQITAAQQLGPDLQLLAASSEPEYTEDGRPAKTSVVGVKRPRAKVSGQSSLEYVRHMTHVHIGHARQLTMESACQFGTHAGRSMHVPTTIFELSKNSPQPPIGCSSVCEANTLHVVLLYMFQQCISTQHCSANIAHNSVWHAEDDDEPG